jgi:hypothetical protein
MSSSAQGNPAVAQSSAAQPADESFRRAWDGKHYRQADFHERYSVDLGERHWQSAQPVRLAWDGNLYTEDEFTKLLRLQKRTFTNASAGSSGQPDHGNPSKVRKTTAEPPAADPSFGRVNLDHGPVRSQKKRPSTNASAGSSGQPDHGKPSKVRRTSAEPPAADPSSEGTICFITHGGFLRSDAKPDIILELRLSLQVAVEHNPDIICVCLSHVGSTAGLIREVMEALCVELKDLEREGKARPIAERSFVVGVICISFTPLLRKRQIDPERGFPAMLLSVGSVVMVAASWPQMPQRACHRVFAAYMQEAMNEAGRASSSSAAQPGGIMIAGNFNYLHMCHIDGIAAEADCKAIQNGSNVVFLAGCLTIKDIKILHTGEVCVGVLHKVQITPVQHNLHTTSCLRKGEAVLQAIH